jgi:hypothetical protein
MDPHTPTTPQSAAGGGNLSSASLLPANASIPVANIPQSVISDLSALLQEKLSTLISNFQYIYERSRHLPTLSESRGLSLVSRLCKAEYQDYSAKYHKPKSDALLGKRRDKHVVNMVREIDTKRLKRVQDSKSPIIGTKIEPEVWDDEKRRQMLECIGDDVEKLKRLRKIHMIKALQELEEKRMSTGAGPETNWSSSGKKAVEPNSVINELGSQEQKEESKDKLVSENESSNILSYDKLLIEVALESKLSLDAKFAFLWDILSEEFDKDEPDSKYKAYLNYILSQLERMSELRIKSSKSWETFIKRLPNLDSTILQHVWKITKHDKTSILMFELVQHGTRELKIEGLNYILRMGKLLAN